MKMTQIGTFSRNVHSHSRMGHTESPLFNLRVQEKVYGVL